MRQAPAKLKVVFLMHPHREYSQEQIDLARLVCGCLNRGDLVLVEAPADVQ